MRTVIVTAFICIAAIVTGYFMLKPKEKERKLPVINPIDVEEEMVENSMQRMGYGHKIQSFSFTDQNNKTVNDMQVKGKIWVAEYFFTTCGTICPKMNQQMMRVQNEFKNDNDIKILSFTVDPETDTPEQLKTYADGHGAIENQWYFLTGKKEDLYQFARKSIFVLKPAEAANLGDAGSDFIHTNNFVLIDKEGRIRGYYDGTDNKEVTQLISDIKLLKKEKPD